MNHRNHMGEDSRLLKALCIMALACGFGLNGRAQNGDAVHFAVPGDLEVTLVASEPMIRNPVAVSVAPDNTVYVTETQRRKAQNLDIRSNADWISAELGLHSVGMKKAFYHSTLIPANSQANAHRVEDYNKDGVHDWRDLTALSEFIHALKDTDGDGRADRATVFAGDFNTSVTGVAAGVLAWGGHIYANVAPHVWKMKDTDGDGVADERLPLAYGFASHIAYGGHNTHGVMIGPDRRIYWSVGDTSSDYTPHEGAVFRCNPDGTGLEVFARGLRNPQEMAFDDFGNLFTGDNDADFGDRERWYYLVEGADYGWRFWWQYQPGGARWDAPDSDYSVWMNEKLWHERFPGQAAYIIPAIQLIDNGPCGMTAYPGVGFGPEYKNSFFLAHFTGSTANSGVRKYKISPQGADFSLDEDKKFLTGAVMTGVDFAPDGSGLYVTDWSGSWPLNSQGRVYRISHPIEGQSDIVRQSHHLLNGGMDGMSADRLGVLLSHDNRNVRREAQFRLVDLGRPGWAELTTIAGSGKNQTARIHAIWGLDIVGRTRPARLKPLLPLLSDEDPEIRAQAAKALGDNRYRPAIEPLRGILADPDQPERVHFMALMALGKLRDSQSLASALEILHRNAAVDLMLRHAGIFYLQGLNDWRTLASLSSHESQHVRLAAVVALRQMENPHVAGFLMDSDPLVIAEVARAINDVPLETARPHLARLIDRPIADEAVARRVLNAHYRTGTSESAHALAEYASSGDSLAVCRVEALKMLRQWISITPRDRVCGGWFPLGYNHTSKTRNGDDAAAAVSSRLSDLLDGPEPVAIETIAIVEAFNIELDKDVLRKWAEDGDRQTSLRLAALNLLARRQSPDLGAVLDVILQSDNASLRARALVLVNEIDSGLAGSLIDSALTQSSVEDVRKVLNNLDGLRNRTVNRRLGLLMASLESGQADPSLALDIFNAASRSSDDQIKKRAEDFMNRLRERDGLSVYVNLCADGGDPSEGRKVFIEKVELACLRCHQVPDGDGQSVGGTMGPNLAGLTGRGDVRYLIQSIVDPNARFAQGFEMLTLQLNDGSTVSGRLVSEAADGSYIEVELPVATEVDEFGIEIDEASEAKPETRRIAGSEISSRSRGVSAMPPGLHQLMSLEEFRNLTAYLRSLK